MIGYSVSHFSDPALERSMLDAIARENGNSAWVLAHIAEFDRRRLYLEKGHPSMYSYCVHVLHFSEDAACKRIRAARAARDFPAILSAVAMGQLHLSGIVLLAPHLTQENGDELLAAAAHQTKAAIERMIARRFPQPDLSMRLEPATPLMMADDHQSARLCGGADHLAAGAVAVTAGTTPAIFDNSSAPGRMNPPRSSGRLTPLSAECFALQGTIKRSTHDKLRYIQSLLSHQIASSDLDALLSRLCDVAIPHFEKARFGATARPRRAPRSASHDPRHIPANVKRAVWQRDGGQCTFVGDTGDRCPSRDHIEFDHTEPVARGGQATVSGTRLLCRAHNQYEAERAFGAEFMRGKREAAREAAVDRRRAAARPAAGPERVVDSSVSIDTPARTDCAPMTRDIIQCLRNLGFRADESRAAATWSERIPEASLELRIRTALSYLGRPSQAAALRSTGT